MNLIPGVNLKSNVNPHKAGMPINAFEGAACLRVLIGFAKSNGPLMPAELAVLGEAWDKLALPATMTLQKLLGESIDLPSQLSRIESEEGRERTYTATYLLAHSGGPCSTSQQELLASIRTSLHLSDDMATPLSRIYEEVRGIVSPGLTGFVADPATRSTKVYDEILKCALGNAVNGACPIQDRAVATGVIIFSAQTLMVRTIGHYWGFAMDAPSARLLMERIQGKTGMRIAIQSLLGETCILNDSLDSTTSYVTTWALGIVANKHFEGGRKLESETLRKHFAVALEEGKVECERCRAEIAAAVHSRSITLDLLNEELMTGEIDSEEYDRKIMALQ